MKNITFSLRYFSNFKRKDAGTFAISNEEITSDIVYNYILNLIIENEEIKEIPLVDSPMLLVIKDEEFKILSQSDIDNAILNNQVLRLVFSNLVLPCGAAEIARIEGISLYFNSNERNHSPHIHAKCAEEEVSILLSSPHKVKGKMKKEKLKVVLNYIDNNLIDLLEQWKIYTNADARYK